MVTTISGEDLELVSPLEGSLSLSLESFLRFGP